VSSGSSSSSDSEAERRKRKKRKEDKKKKKKRSKDTRKSKQRSPSVHRSAEEPFEAQLELTDSVEPVDTAQGESQVVAGEPAAADTGDAEAAAAHSDAHAMAPPPPVIQAAAAPRTTAAAAPAPEPKVSKAAFFAKLQAVEARKEPVGTVHSKGKSVYTTSKTLKTAETSDKWECPKCGTEQNKHNTSCEKCHGLKRLSVWR
jgi:predicted RNA-binding Zn-ribbon protein involved in translation (DUF1610 family)